MDHKYFKSKLLTMTVLLIGLLPMPNLGADNINNLNDFYNASTLQMKYKANENFRCPQHCNCTVPIQHHGAADDGDILIHPIYLHAICTSLDGLMIDEPLQVTLPIHSIDLSHLNLKRLPNQVLEKLPYLTTIDLSHNDLLDIGHLGRRIKKLYLNHNRLTSQKLMKLPANIQVLNLQHNDIKQLPLELLKLMQLQRLELSENYINCTCETLMVRNWLQKRNVFMEGSVICGYPDSVKGKSWLQLKQSLICENVSTTDVWDGRQFEENELMLGDAPRMDDGNSGDGNVEGSGDQIIINGRNDCASFGNGNANANANDDDDIFGNCSDNGYGEGSDNDNDNGIGNDNGIDHPNHDDTDEELKKDFIPLSKPLGKERSILDNVNEIEGSGSESNGVEDNVFMDASGSGDGAIIYPISHTDLTTTDPYDHAAQNNELLPLTPDIFKINMGIFEKAHKTLDNTTETLSEAHQHNDDDNDNDDDDNNNNNNILSIVASSGVLATPGPDSSEEEELENSIELANADSIKDANLAHSDGSETDDTPATYFLLGIIAFILLSMIAYVSIRRCKQRRSHRLHGVANGNDIEHAQRELVDMDREHLGKPLRNGVPEHVPLIKKNHPNSLNEKPDGSYKDVKDGHDHDHGQPLLNGNGTPNVATHDNSLPMNKVGSELQLHDPHEYYPISPRYPTPQSPRASKYGGSVTGGTLTQEPNNNIDKETAVLPPKSPKSMGRYSPVYSPETGRVKIKLTEMPKPKTPMLVTRSRSNAGDIIMTPIHMEQQQQHNSNSNNISIHTSATNGLAKAH